MLHELVLSAPDPMFAIVTLLASDLLAVISLPSLFRQRPGRRATTMSWLLAFFAIPWIGVASWWVFGRDHLHRRKRKRRASHEQFSAATGRPVGTAGPLFEGLLPDADEQPAPTHGNDVELYVDGEQAFPAMCASIRSARRDIHLLFYIWQDDEIGRRVRDLLIERAREGVEVRVLVDGWGSLLLPRRFVEPLRRAGVRVATFLPLRPWRASALNFRNHRKLIVVDGREAFTGGMNLGHAYAAVYHDLMIRVTGPAVTQLDAVFLDDWYYATSELLETPKVSRSTGDVATAVLASGPDQWHNHVHDALFMAISQARQRVWIMTPYFVPGSAILSALRGAALRGLDVRLLVPRRSDVMLAHIAGRALYPAMVEAGVRVCLYQEELHGKALLIDRDLCMVGTVNTDYRSLQLNFELSCLFRSEPLARRLERVFLADFGRSTIWSRDEGSRGPPPENAVSSVAQLFARLL